MDAAGISQTLMTQWEGGRAVNPKPDRLRAVCTALDIPIVRALMALEYLTEEDLADYQAPASRAQAGDDADLIPAEIHQIFTDPVVPPTVRGAVRSYGRWALEQSQQEPRGAE